MESGVSKSIVSPHFFNLKFYYGRVRLFAVSFLNIFSSEIPRFASFLPDPCVSGVRSMGLGVSIYLSPGALVDFVDVTLADDDTNSILLMMPI